MFILNFEHLKINTYFFMSNLSCGTHVAEPSANKDCRKVLNQFCRFLPKLKLPISADAKLPLTKSNLKHALMNLIMAILCLSTPFARLFVGWFSHLFRQKCPTVSCHVPWCPSVSTTLGCSDGLGVFAVEMQ